MGIQGVERSERGAVRNHLARSTDRQNQKRVWRSIDVRRGGISLDRRGFGAGGPAWIVIRLSTLPTRRASVGRPRSRRVVRRTNPFTP